MARAQRRRGPRSRRASRERRSRGAVDAVDTSASESAIAASPATAPRVPPPRRRWNPFGFLKRLQPRAVADVISELRKVTWPSFAETRYLTIVVAIVAIVIGVILGLFDLLFGWLVERLFF